MNGREQDGRGAVPEWRQTAGGAARITLIVLGVGLLVSLLAGLLVGWIIGDLPRGLGRTVAVGMLITAFVGIALNVFPRRR